MKIREATSDDLETIVTFNRQLAIDSGDDVPREPMLRAGVGRALDQPELCRYFLATAEDGGEILGQCMVTYEWSDWRDGTIWWFQSVFVKAEWRGKGVFDRLYDHVRSLANADPDARELRLYVLESNSRAQRAYQRCGMKPSGYVVYEGKLGESQKE